VPGGPAALWEGTDEKGSPSGGWGDKRHARWEGVAGRTFVGRSTRRGRESVGSAPCPGALGRWSRLCPVAMWGGASDSVNLGCVPPHRLVFGAGAGLGLPVPVAARIASSDFDALGDDADDKSGKQQMYG